MPVFKHLVVADKPIPQRHRHRREPQMLHLAILRVCQQSYHECIALLLKFNTPRISCHIGSTYPTIMDWCYSRSRSVTDIAYNSFLNDVVPQFSRLHVTIGYDHGFLHGRLPMLEHLAKFVTMLGKLNVQEKEIIVEFTPELKIRPEAESDNWIGALGCIRCKKFSVVDVDESLLADMIAVVEGRSRITDIMTQCREVSDHFEACQVAAKLSHVARSRERILERELKQAARLYRLAEYENARAKILARCDELVDMFRTRHEDIKAVVNGDSPW